MRPESDRAAELAAALKRRSYRLTPQRLAVMRALAGLRHPTADEIFDAVRADFPTTSASTVYNTLIVLREVGQVLELEFGDAPNRYDALRPEPHPHLVCAGCGAIEDLAILDLPPLAAQVERETGYVGVEPRLEFRGLCPGCAGRREGRS